MTPPLLVSPLLFPAFVEERPVFLRSLYQLLLAALEGGCALSDAGLTLLGQAMPQAQARWLQPDDPSAGPIACSIAAGGDVLIAACPVMTFTHVKGFYQLSHTAGVSDHDCRLLAAICNVVGLVWQSVDGRELAENRSHLLERQVQQLSDQLDHIHDSVIGMDLGGYITSWNRGAEELFGYSSAEAVGRHILFLYADETEEDGFLFNSFLEQGRREMLVRRRRKNGDVFWASLVLTLQRDEKGRPMGLTGYLVDVTDRIEAEESIRLHARILELSSDAVLVTDADKRIMSVNQAFTAITGLSLEQVQGQMPSFLHNDLQDETFFNMMDASLEAIGRWQGELWDRRHDGTEYPMWLTFSAVKDQQGKILHYFSVFSDLSERKAAEAEIHRLAFYDKLTKLPNRSMLFSLLEQSLTEARRNKNHGALLSLDIHRFKHINESFGHSEADRVLTEFAARMRTALREEDILSRIGGDQFVVALLDIANREDARYVATRMLEALQTPFIVSGHEVQLSIAIGISVFPDDGFDADGLISFAEMAMVRAKQQGVGFLFYSQEMNLRSLERVKLENDLKRALAHDEFCLYYQPQYDVRTGRVFGAEALIRWQKPDGVMVPPGQFIPFAEETGLIRQIGEWVLKAICKAQARWREHGVPPVRVAMNVSGLQFRPGLAQHIVDTLRAHDIPISQLEVEFTETILMQHDATVESVVAEFQRLGLAISLDDFGTGYSNLAYLKRFPIDFLKIDQQFVRGTPHNPNDVAITRAIVRMAQELGIQLIAEGVETSSQRDFLHELGCQYHQGFFFKRPMPEAEFCALLRAQPEPG